MATQLALNYDSATIEYARLRWHEDLTPKQRATIASEAEKERFWPELRYLDPRELVVDESYQRPISKAQVWYMTTHFMPQLFNSLWVGLRVNAGKKLHVLVDGRHRNSVAVLLPEMFPKGVPCEIRRTAGVKEEAEIFVALQKNRRPVTPAQMFAAQLLRGDPTAVELDRLFRKYKFFVNFESLASGSQYAAPNQIVCIRTLEKLLRAKGGRERVNGILQIVREAWDGKARTTRAEVFRALNRILETRNLSVDTIVRRLRNGPEPDTLIERARLYAARHDFKYDIGVYKAIESTLDAA